MDLTLLIHPAFAASIVVLVAAAFLLKTRKRLYFRLHYAMGILASAAAMAVFPLGLYLVLTSGGVSLFPEELVFHTVSFLAAVALIVVQGGLGMGILLFGRKRNVYRTKADREVRPRCVPPSGDPGDPHALRNSPFVFGS